MSKILTALALTALTTQVMAQHKPAQVYTKAEIQHQLSQLVDQAKDKGGSGATLGDFGSHALKLSVRSSSGGAEIHAHFDDVLVVTEGSASLITGGTLVDPHTGSDGESKGTSILNGVTQTVSPGDVVHVPAGTPHQLLIAKGVLFSAFVVKIHEQ